MTRCDCCHVLFYENGNGRLAGATDTIGACDIPLFDLIGNLSRPVAHGSMIMRPRGRHKDIKYTGCFSK